MTISSPSQPALCFGTSKPPSRKNSKDNVRDTDAATESNAKLLADSISPEVQAYLDSHDDFSAQLERFLNQHNAWMDEGDQLVLGTLLEPTISQPVVDLRMPVGSPFSIVKDPSHTLAVHDEGKIDLAPGVVKNLKRLKNHVEEKINDVTQRLFPTEAPDSEDS